MNQLLRVQQFGELRVPFTYLTVSVPATLVIVIVTPSIFWQESCRQFTAVDSRQKDEQFQPKEGNAVFKTRKVAGSLTVRTLDGEAEF